MVLNYRALLKLIGIITVLLAGFMLPSLLVSWIYGETDAAAAFTWTIVPMLIVGVVIILTVKADFNHLRIRDGYVIVALCWTLASALGAVPFVISGYIPDYINAFFEAASGFTTTGASILTDIEALPRGLLFWRSFTHWVGGMGIIVFAIALLPMLGISGQRIARAETTGPTFGKLTPKLTDSSKILYVIYIGMSILEVLLLMFGGMSFYNALVHTFATVGTGGFSTYNLSIGHFGSVYFESVIVIFMVLAGINFTLYYYVLRGRWNEIFSDSEFRCYLLIFGSAVLLITLNLWLSGSCGSLGRSLRYSFFQSASIMTTTGFSSADFDLWPTFSKMILFILMFIGGCSSSTSGGIKTIRILLLLKLIKRGIAIRLHPNAVVSIKVNGKPIPSETISATVNFTFLFFAVFFIGSVLLSLENFDLVTTFSAVAACIGNIGPGFSLVGPMVNYSLFSDASTLMLAFMMLIGRLELFTIILLFTRQFWNPDR